MAQVNEVEMELSLTEEGKYKLDIWFSAIDYEDKPVFYTVSKVYDTEEEADIVMDSLAESLALEEVIEDEH